MAVLTRRSRIYIATAALCLALTQVSVGAAPTDPNLLWKIVHYLCVANERAHGRPSPCMAVQLRNGEQEGYALLKDRVGATEVLLIPTARVTGIESSVVLAPDAPNYFAFAWQARTFIDRTLHRTLPRENIALAVNSALGRSQNQLHIHIDCVRTDVRDTLRAAEASIGDTWAPFPLPLAGHRYVAMRLAGQDLTRANPFKLLADGWPSAGRDMGAQTLVVIGARFANGDPGFILLDDHADRASGNPGSGEELEDHTCAVARS